MASRGRKAKDISPDRDQSSMGAAAVPVGTGRRAESFSGLAGEVVSMAGRVASVDARQRRRRGGSEGGHGHGCRSSLLCLQLAIAMGCFLPSISTQLITNECSEVVTTSTFGAIPRWYTLLILGFIPGNTQVGITRPLYRELLSRRTTAVTF